jgi:hypothetical protein
MYGWNESCCIQRDVKSCEFVLDTKDYCLKLNPICENEECDLVSYSDSDQAGNSEIRISVNGLIIYVLGAPICWRLKGQKGVTLSSSEAEYVAMSETVKVICFIYFLLKGMGVDVKLPIVVRFSWLRTQVQELEHVILIPGIVLFVNMLICLRKIEST